MEFTNTKLSIYLISSWYLMPNVDIYNSFQMTNRPIKKNSNKRLIHKINDRCRDARVLRRRNSHGGKTPLPVGVVPFQSPPADVIARLIGHGSENFSGRAHPELLRLALQKGVKEEEEGLAVVHQPLRQAREVRGKDPGETTEGVFVDHSYRNYGNLGCVYT